MAQISTLTTIGLLVVAVIAVLVSIVAIRVSNAGNRAQRLAFSSQIRSEWESLHECWSTVLLLRDMTWSYYSDASVDEKNRVRRLINRVNARPESISLNVELMRQETRGLRQVARFFAYVSEAILSGKMSTRDAYAIFGPDVARHPRSIYWIAGRESVRDSSIDMGDEWSLLVDQIVEPNFFNDQDLIVAFGDLMSSELARRGDGHPHLILERAFVRNQPHERERVRIEIRGLTRGFFRQIRRIQIRWQLSFSARVPWDSVRARIGREPIFYDGDENLIRKSFVTRRAFHAEFQRNYPKLSPRGSDRDGR